MAVESDADRRVFTNSNEFGTAATYTPLAGGSRSINLIFDAAAKAIDLITGLPVSTVNPLAYALTVDLVNGGAHNETLVIGGVTYLIRDMNPDGQGITKLELQKQ